LADRGIAALNPDRIWRLAKKLHRGADHSSGGCRALGPLKDSHFAA